jgi:RNA polymerase sigma factor (sigma-70 family)
LLGCSMHTPGDSELLRRYVTARDQAAFGELVQRYVGLVYHAALRKVGGDTHRAEDVTQVVFTRLAQKAGGLMRHQALAGWLHTTTRFAANEILRAERRRLAREVEAQLMHELSHDEGAAGDWARLRPVIDDALGGLNDADREAVLLRFFAGLALADVGAKLNLSENAARMRVERALQKLRLRLNRCGIASTDAALGTALASYAALPAPIGLVAKMTSMTAGAASIGVGMSTGPLVSMSTAKWVVGLGLGLMAIGTLTYYADASRNADQAVVFARKDHAAQLEKLKILHGRLSAAEEEAERWRRRLAEARPSQAKTGGPGGRNADTARWDPVAEGRAFLAQHPEVQQALDDYARARFNFEYAPLIRELGLAPEQAERLRMVATGGSMGATLVDGRNVSLPYGKPNADTSGQIRELLGDPGFQRWQEYWPTVGARRIVAETASALYFTDTPLTPQQADELVPIVAASQRPGGAHDWDAIINRATGLLSPPQIEVLAGRRAGEQFLRALNRHAPVPESAKRPAAVGG